MVREIDISAWNEVLARHGVRDPYFQHGWLRASLELESPGAREALLVVAGPDGEEEGAAIVAMIVRPVPGSPDCFDATSTYGYGGPTCVGASPPDAAATRAGLDAWAAECGVVGSFLRFHPLLDTMRFAPAGATVHASAGTVGWRLTPAVDLLEGMHKHHRRAVRKADREGVAVEVREATTFDELASFRMMYDVTMRRQDADEFYFFSEEYWRRLAADPGGTLLTVTASRDEDGGDIAGLLVVDDGVNLHYHLGASLDAARAVGASNRCFLEAAMHGQRLGRGLLHLGGGVGGGDDSLLQFKHRFDPESPLLPFGVAKLVHDRATYRALAGTDSLDGYFPPWRAPIAAGGA